MTLLIYFIISIILILLLTIIMALLHNKIAKFTTVLLVPTVLGGLIIYLMAYMPEGGSFAENLTAFFKALISTSGLFIDNANFEDIQNNNAIVSTNTYIIAYWACRILALIVVLFTAFSVFGKKLLSNMRKMIKFNKEVYIIYGVTDKSLSFAQNILTLDDAVSKDSSGEMRKRAKSRCVIFLDEYINENLQDKINRIRATYHESHLFIKNDFNYQALKKCGFKNKKLFRKPVYIIAFTDSDIINYNIVNGVLDYIEKYKISYNMLSGIYINSESEVTIDKLKERVENLVEDANEKQKQKGNTQIKSKNALHENDDKYFSFTSFSESDLAARLLFKDHPLHERLVFNKNTGLPISKNTLKILILGFGQTGKHILREAMTNGQFLGCTFEAIIVDRNMSDMLGQFYNNYPTFSPSFSDKDKLDTIKIKHLSCNVNSECFYQHIEEYITKEKEVNFDIDYVVSNLGDESLNLEIVSNIRKDLKRNKVKKMPIFSVHIADKHYKQYASGKEENLIGVNIFGDYDDIFTVKNIINAEIDILAQAVNEVYIGEQWAYLSIHYKNSNRATASFIKSFLYILGFELKVNAEKEDTISREEFKSIFKSNSQLVENLGQIEHLRWNAFHYANGWSKMEWDEVNSYQGRIDVDNKLHACLVPWDDLIEIGTIIFNRSEKYNRKDSDNLIEKTNFQAKDTSNIHSLYDMIDNYNKNINEDKKLYIVRRQENEQLQTQSN